MNSSCVVILSGPSSVGKTTVAKKLLGKNKIMQRVITCTSRKPREEKEQYIFLKEEDFLKKIKQNKFIEYSKVYTNYYGVLKSEFLKVVKNCIYSLIIVDVVGFKKLTAYCKEQNIPQKSIFLLPTHKKELIDRLNTRKEKILSCDDNIKERLKQVEIELQISKEFDKIIVNQDLEASVLKIENFIFDK